MHIEFPNLFEMSIALRKSIEDSFKATQKWRARTELGRTTYACHSTENIKSATAWPHFAWTDARQLWCVSPNLFARAISGPSTALGSAKRGFCRSALRLCRDHTGAFPHGPLSTQGVRRHHCRSVLCSGFPWQHRSIHRTPRGIWVGHGHGSTCRTFLSAFSGRRGALEYRGVDSPSTILGQTRMITVRCILVAILV